MSDQPSPSTQRTRIPSLKHRNFRLFISGQIISLIGTWMQTAALGWIVWKMTNDAIKLGALVFASQIPNLVFAPVAGVLADRYSRHRLVILTQALAMIQALVLAILTLFGLITFPQILALAFFLGMINSFDMPIRQSFVVEMVGREDLPNAIAINSFVFNAARISGPPIAGFALNHVAPGNIFLINAASYVVVIGALLRMRLASKPTQLHEGNMMQRLAEALAFVSKHRALRDPLVYVGLIGLMGLPYNSMMPVLTTEVLHRRADGYGILLAMIGVGALLGAVVMVRGHLSDHMDRMIPIGGFFFGTGLVAVSFSHTYWLSAVLLIPAGGAMMMQTLATNTLLQKLVPERLRGRVMSFYTMMLLGLIPLGSLLAGYLKEQIGILSALRVGGTCCALGGIILFARLGKLRESADTLHGMDSPHA